MIRPFASAVAILATTVLVAPPTTRAEDKVAAVVLPTTVTDAIAAKFPKAEIVAGKKKTDDAKINGGKDFYCVQILDDKKKSKVEVTEAGVILATKAEVAKADVPKAVAATLDKDHPKGEVKGVDSFKKNDDVLYEVELLSDGSTWFIIYDELGTEKSKHECKDPKPAK